MQKARKFVPLICFWLTVQTPVCCFHFAACVIKSGEHIKHAMCNVHNKSSIIANICYTYVTPASKLCLDITLCVYVHELEIIIRAYGCGILRVCSLALAT